MGGLCEVEHTEIQKERVTSEEKNKREREREREIRGRRKTVHLGLRNEGGEAKRARRVTFSWP